MSLQSMFPENPLPRNMLLSFPFTGVGDVSIDMMINFARLTRAPLTYFLTAGFRPSVEYERQQTRQTQTTYWFE